MRFLDFGASALVACTPIERFDADTFEQLELASLGNAVEKRRTEFQAGRRLARQLMTENGHKPAAIPVAANRLPEWPPGVVASISHTDSDVAVALARSARIASLGLDIERIDAVTSDLVDHVLLPNEKELSRNGGASLTAYFSAKEAVFKACFSIAPDYFDFTDIEILFTAGHFRARPVVRLAAADVIANGHGATISFDDHIASLFTYSH